MKIRCAGCGEKQRVSFQVWWFYVLTQPDNGPYPHYLCWRDMEDQRRIDGV